MALLIFSKRSHYALLVSILVLSLFFWQRRAKQQTHQSSRCVVINRPSLCRTASVFRCDHCIPDPAFIPNRDENEAVTVDKEWKFVSDRDSKNYRLTDSQCETAFPGLFEDIRASAKARKDRPITPDELLYSKWPRGTIHLMIYEEELYVIKHPEPERFKARSEATLHALYRAILTSPSPLPNSEFAITLEDFEDNPSRLIWSYTRTADDQNTWLMPDFGFWSHGEPHTPAALGSWNQVRDQTRDVEERYPSFSSKIPKAFWRGEVLQADSLRSELLKRVKQKPWADIKDLNLRWNDKEKIDIESLPIHEVCRYKFLIHTEGNSYSGRLKYLQNCRSLIFAHTFEWIQPMEYLMVSSGPKQNYVEVSRDFSNLVEVVEYYLAHPSEAERIANNSIITFRDRYNTPAAEACYWRRLIRSWREVSFEPEFYVRQSTRQLEEERKPANREWRGTPFENYAMRWQLDNVDVTRGWSL